MAEPTSTVTRCYKTGSGYMVTVQGRAMSFPIDAEVDEGVAVRIIDGRAVRA